MLGPSATWLLRRMAGRLEVDPEGYELDVAETAACLGLAAASAHSPFHRALGRLIRFAMSRPAGHTSLAVRPNVSPVPERLRRRLPPGLQEQHRIWVRRHWAADEDSLGSRTRGELAPLGPR